tara:strand:- start:3684 stop:3866 length:183 start_codon:yes stop_codon:yes gene_type:complete
MTRKEKIDKILYDSHVIRSNAQGTDISKKEKAEAQLASRKLLKQLKEIAPEVYDRIKIEL